MAESKKIISIQCLMLFVGLILLCIISDQVSKSFLINHLKTQPGYNISFSSYLDIVYTWNYGISFGLFKQYYQYSNFVFLILNSFIIIFLIYLLIQANNNIARTAFAIIIGGAIGNLLDRIMRGAVFDFIHVHYHNIYHFPVFNLADAFISIGAVIYIYENFYVNYVNTNSNKT